MKTTCATCGKPLTVKPSRHKPGRNYCSRDCHNRSGAPRPERKTGLTKKCAVCGRAFYTCRARSNARFCGMTCKGIASRLPTKPCAVCGKIFKPPMGRGDQPTCSRQCGARLRRNGETRTCLWCQTKYYIPASQTGDSRFCSMSCLNQWQGRGKTVHECKICGKTFRWSPSRAKSYRITYCSLKCRDADPDRKAMLLSMNKQQRTLKVNKVERIGYAILDELGIPYEAQRIIAGKFCVDAFAPALQLVIQFDGDYWHANPEKFPEPDARQRKRIHLDKSQDAYMKKCGYDVIRIWEGELKGDVEGVKARLRQTVTRQEQKTAAPV